MEKKKASRFKEKEPKKEKTKVVVNKFKFIRSIVIVLIALALVAFILNVAPDFMMEKEPADKTNLVINNNNITNSLKRDLIIKDNIIYISQPDIANFFDKDIYYDEKSNLLITTYDKKLASIELGTNNITVNGTEKTIAGGVIIEGNTRYLPFSEMLDVYNVEIEKIDETNIITVDSLDREQIKADATKNLSVKSKTKTLSRTVDKIKKGEKVIVISTDEEGWSSIRTERGKIGYVKDKYLANKITVREELESEIGITGKINMVWDYYSEYVSAPDRSGTTIEGVNVVSPAFFELEESADGEVLDKVGTSGRNYIEWAKENGYQVWAMFSNNASDSMIKVTSEIMNDYYLRKETIDNLIELAVQYNLDGINVDFEYMYEEDIDLFSRFIIELQPRLKEVGMVLSVDVTAPDGSPNWSMCYDRNNIASNCDYIVFMAYDQYGNGSTKAGTTAGYDWIKVNLNKFLETEDIDASKIILGLPFFTRIWEENSNGELIDNDVVDMENIDNVIPNSVKKVWKDDVKQNYIEYENSGHTYKMWIEDEESMRAKLSLITENELAGAAFWSKGRESEDIWGVIHEELNK